MAHRRKAPAPCLRTLQRRFRHHHGVARAFAFRLFGKQAIWNNVAGGFFDFVMAGP